MVDKKTKHKHIVTNVDLFVLVNSRASNIRFECKHADRYGRLTKPIYRSEGYDRYIDASG